MNEEQVKKLYELRRGREWVMAQYVRVIEDEQAPWSARLRALDKYTALKGVKPQKIRKDKGKVKKIEERQGETDLVARLAKFPEVTNGHSQ